MSIFISFNNSFIQNMHSVYFSTEHCQISKFLKILFFVIDFI